jgi:hypothetical protein
VGKLKGQEMTGKNLLSPDFGAGLTDFGAGLTDFGGILEDLGDSGGITDPNAARLAAKIRELEDNLVRLSNRLEETRAYIENSLHPRTVSLETWALPKIQGEKVQFARNKQLADERAAAEKYQREHPFG